MWIQGLVTWSSQRFTGSGVSTLPNVAGRTVLLCWYRSWLCSGDLSFSIVRYGTRGENLSPVHSRRGFFFFWFGLGGRPCRWTGKTRRHSEEKEVPDFSQQVTGSFVAVTAHVMDLRLAFQYDHRTESAEAIFPFKLESWIIHASLGPGALPFHIPQASLASGIGLIVPECTERKAGKLSALCKSAHTAVKNTRKKILASI